MGDMARTWSRISEIYALVHGELCPGEVVLTYLGQMVVSRDRIRSVRKAAYDHLLGVLESEMGHWIHRDEKEGMFRDEETNPYFGHTVERGWMVLWGCEDPGLVDRCGGGTGALFQGRGEGEEAEKCQCLDGKGPG